VSVRLAGKTAIISGAGQTPGETLGNGRATALLFAREGARLLCVDRILERAEETVAIVRSEGGKADAVQANIVEADDVAKIVAAARDKLGRIDILVNNVGIGGGDAPAHRVEEAAFDRILAVNLKGTWLVTKAVLALMREQKSGSIVNISSLAALAGGIQVAYEVSKAAVNRLTTSVAQSQARYGIRCNAVQPGLMDTPMAVAGIAGATGRSQAEVRAERDARVPLGGKMGTAWDTAHAVLFLASDDAKFISGAILPVDGGMCVRIG
jgi:NAD(P)-dependent dehydrogenase (short-subunit alcohol dehydrogenase family)